MSYLDYFPVPMADHATVALSVAVGVIMTGLAIAFIAAEPRSSITRAFAVAYGLSGLAATIENAWVLMYPEGAAMPWFVRFPVFLWVSLGAYPIWLLLLARTAQPTPRAMNWIVRCVWLQWAMVLVFAVFSVLYPSERLHDFYLGVSKPGFLTNTDFWLFGAPILIGTINLTLAGAILFGQGIDPAERRRVLAFAISFPFLACIFILPAGYNFLAALVGVLIFLAGAIGYYVMQGERGLFMSRFLSPQVADMVRRRGLIYTMQPQSLEITAVCCDLRGFTRLSQLLASEQVIRLLNEYYETVGHVVAEFGATIKDYAGDGILILVGAPVPMPDHAARGLALARHLNQNVHGVIEHWVGTEHALGFGIGVASGRVTVGAIGSAFRMEYSAVGQAVNLSARLCAQAQDAEILVSPHTVHQVGDEGFEVRGGMTVQGLEGMQFFTVSQSIA